MEPYQTNGNGAVQETLHGTRTVSGLYKNWFLDYASYVILERAVPSIHDGLKPVQRRILHSMKEIDDGRFNKVANVIGHTMQYHPHGDAAIGDALVNLGQKDLMIETQGNWGDVRTGDSAAAPRYIEARLSKFALEVSFNPDTTVWQASYDGRKKEPINLPMKFPLLLAQGVEGIAVGLATKVLPHNFIELIKASISILKGRNISIYPDFPTGGTVDVTNYNEGMKGGRVRVRARIDVVDKKNLVIRDIPFGVTTTSLMESIVKANDNNKIKIKRVIDNTARDVEVVVELPPGISPDITIDALYAFTECEVSISPNACVIIDDKPHFMSVNELLRISTHHTVGLLKRELEIRKAELSEKWHFSSLEKIFIENRIYRDIEECETWEAVIRTIDKGLEPFKKILFRAVTEEDIVRLTEIRIKRISKFDAFKADELIRALETEMEEVQNNLDNLIDYAIVYFEALMKKYGKGRERRTEIRTFDTIQVTQVAVANQKLYVNRKDGFIGYGLKKDEFVCECSDLDDIIVFLKDGRYLVSRITEKSFVGKDIIHVAVWKKADERMVYNAVYLDGKSGVTYAKRFAVTAVTRDKEYDISRGTKGSKLHYLTANPNSESEIVTVTLHPNCTARLKEFEFDFGPLDIKNRSSLGNIMTKYPVKKITQKELGASTLGGRDIWYDPSTGRLNTDERGTYLGEFDTDDLILVVYNEGSYELTTFELTNRYEHDKVLAIEKFEPDVVISAVHYDGEQKNYYVKRFNIEARNVGKRYLFINESRGSKLVAASTVTEPVVEVKFQRAKSREKETEQVKLDEFIAVKGWKAIGNRLNPNKVTSVKLLDTGAKKPVKREGGKKKKRASAEPELFE